MKKFEYFADTDETIVSDLTKDELAERKLMEAQAKAEAEQLEANLAAKEAAKLSAETKLAALGLTADEIAALKG
jgi:hypothetical protein